MPSSLSTLPYWRLSGYYFFYFAFIGAFSPYFGLYLQSLSFTAWDIGLLMSQMQLMRLFGPYLWGTIADRQARQVPIVRLAAAVSLLGFSAFFLASSFPALLIAMALLAFFWSAALPLVETVTFNHLREHSARYSRIRVWGSIGFVAAVMGTGAALDHAPLNMLLWVCVGMLAGILLCAMAMPEAPLPRSHAETPSIGAILRQTRVRALLAACFAMSAAHGALYIFYSIHLANHGYDNSSIGMLWSLGVVAEILLFLYMADVIRRFGLRAILLASFVAAVLRFALIGWGIDIVTIAVLAQLLHGLTFGAYHAASIAAVNRWFPGKAQARGQALYSSISFGAGGLIGGVLSGWSWDTLGASLTYGASSAWALVGLILVWRHFHDDATTSAMDGAPSDHDRR